MDPKSEISQNDPSHFKRKKGLCVNQSHSLVDTEALNSDLILLYRMLPLMANLYRSYGMVPFDSNRALFPFFGHRNRRKKVSYLAYIKKFHEIFMIFLIRLF